MKAREMQIQMEEERERAQRDVYFDDHAQLAGTGEQFRAVPMGDHIIGNTFDDGARENPRFRTEREEEDEDM